jgi:hypothetical protein
MTLQEHQSRQMGNYPSATKKSALQRPAQQRLQNFDMSRYQQYQTLPEYQEGMNELCRIFEVLRTESRDYQGDLPTSFERVENEIATGISECLADCPEQSRSIAAVQDLLRVYKVVLPLPSGSPSVSLFRIHLILQDNFEGSLLCKLFNILLAKHNNKCIYF